MSDHERADEIDRLRSLLRRACEALKPFADFEPTLREWWSGRIVEKHAWPSHCAVLKGSYPLDEQSNRVVRIYPSAFEDAVKVIREIDALYDGRDDL